MEATRVVASSEERGRQSVTLDPFRYLPLAHVEVACHRSHARGPRHLYVNPIYFEGARPLRIRSVRNRLTYLQKECQYPLS